MNEESGKFKWILLLLLLQDFFRITNISRHGAGVGSQPPCGELWFSHSRESIMFYFLS